MGRAWWLEDWEKQAIIAFHAQNPLVGYVTPADKLAGREPAIFAARDQKLEAARERRQKAREASRPAH